MSDQRSWVKVWLNWLMDPDIQALSFADKGRWIELLLLVAEHGKTGKFLCRRGVGSLPRRWRQGLTSLDLLKRLKSLPGVTVTCEDSPLHEITIEFTNWHKYQLSDSTERVRRWRTSHVTSPVTVTPPVTPKPATSVTREREKNRESSVPRYGNGQPTPSFDPNPLHLNLPDDPAERQRIYDAERRKAIPD